MTDDEKKEMFEKILNQLSEVEKGIRSPKSLTRGIIEGPSCIRFLLEKDNGEVSENRIRTQLPLLKSALRLTERQELNVVNNVGVWLEVPKDENKRTYITTHELWDLYEKVGIKDADDFSVPIGIDQDGAPVTIDFGKDAAAHLLVGGAMGGGKSIAVDTIIQGILKYCGDRVDLFLIDPKRVDLSHLKRHPQKKHYSQDDSKEALEAFCYGIEEMKERYDKFEETGCTKISQFNSENPDKPYKRWVFIIEEFPQLMDDAEGDDKKALIKCIKQLCQLGRAAGIHVIACTQRATADIMPKVIKDNMVGRLALQVADDSASRVILGVNGAETLSGNGEAYYKGGGVGKPIRLQIAKSPDKD